MAERTYVPAASLDLLLPAYDPIMKLLGFRRALIPLIAQAELQAGFSVLDIGCGTGAVTILAAQLHPGISIIGVDPDPLALARAARSASRAGVAVRLDRGFADSLDYPSATFDRV